MLRNKIAEIQKIDDHTWVDTETGETFDREPKQQKGVQFTEERQFAKDQYLDDKYYNKYGKVSPFNIIITDMIGTISTMDAQTAAQTIIDTIEQLNRAYPNDSSYDYVSQEYLNKMKLNFSKMKSIDRILQYMTNIYFKGLAAAKRMRMKKQAESELASMLKEDIQGEYDTIKLYTEHITKINNPEIRDRLIEIRNDETQHLNELRDLYNKWFK